MAEHDESKLPKWAQERLNRLRFDLQEAKTLRDGVEQAHSVLFNRNWFTLQTHGDDKRSFYVLRHDAAVPVCTLYGNDVVLVGREKK